MMFTIKKIIGCVLFLSLLVIATGCGNDLLDGSELTDKSTDDESSVIIGQLNWNEVTDFQNNHPVRQNGNFVGFAEFPNKNPRAAYSTCTGFMVTPTIMMTNDHCVSGSADLSKVTIMFNYVKGIAVKDRQRISCPQLLVKDAALDYALFRCRTESKTFAQLEKINPFQIPDGKDIYVLHQNCDYERDAKCSQTKKFSQGKVVQKKYNCQADKGYICYTADTLAGSSGSPVFNQASHKVIALNNFGWNQNAEQRGPYNSGVAMFNILNYMQKRSPAVYEEIMRSQNADTANNDTNVDVDQTDTYEADQLEPNDNDNQATHAGDFYNGVDLTMRQQDSDLFRVVLPVSGKIKIHFGKTANDRINVKIRKGTQVVTQSQIVGQLTSVSTEIVAAGQYILELSTPSTESIKYSVSIRTTREALDGDNTDVDQTDTNPDVDQTDTNPDTDQTMVDSFIGGPCTSNQQCTYDGGVCLRDQGQGRCSMLCTLQCAYKPGTIPAFCVARQYLNESLISTIQNLSSSDGNAESLCYSQCDRRTFPDTGCRDGATCKELVEQIRNPGTKRNVCFPD